MGNATAPNSKVPERCADRQAWRTNATKENNKNLAELLTKLRLIQKFATLTTLKPEQRADRQAWRTEALRKREESMHTQIALIVSIDILYLVPPSLNSVQKPQGLMHRCSKPVEMDIMKRN